MRISTGNVARNGFSEVNLEVNEDEKSIEENDEAHRFCFEQPLQI